MQRLRYMRPPDPPGRYRGDIGRRTEIYGDIGRCREIWAPLHAAARPTWEIWRRYRETYGDIWRRREM